MLSDPPSGNAGPDWADPRLECRDVCVEWDVSGRGSVDPSGLKRCDGSADAGGEREAGAAGSSCVPIHARRFPEAR